MLTAKNVLSGNIRAKLTGEKHRHEENIDKYSTSKLIDERNNNSDYEEPCKRPKIDLGSCSPIQTVKHFIQTFYFSSNWFAEKSFFILLMYSE